MTERFDRRAFAATSYQALFPEGIPALGRETILAQDPQHRPRKLSKSPAPFVHAATKAARQALYQSYSWFVGEFRKAAEKLRRGDRDVGFPPGCFPPALPFVPG